MPTGSLLRLAGFAAIAGGTLRIAAAFAAALDPYPQQLLFFATDVFLLLGLTGIYLRVHGETGILGLTGFLLTFLGLLIVRSAAVLMPGPSGYQAGAAIALLGTAALAIALRIRRKSMLPAVLWLSAFALGIASAALHAPPLAAISGIAFGLGFISAGVPPSTGTHPAAGTGGRSD